MEVVHLFISKGHNFFGHHDESPGEHVIEAVDAIECVAGRGIRGDRFFDYKKDYKGQITFFAEEIYLHLCQRLDVRDRGPGVFRRNVILRGQDLNALIGTDFEIQGVRFRGTAECSPCYWMDQAFASGAEKMLEGNGGLRAKILTDGFLKTHQ